MEDVNNDDDGEATTETSTSTNTEEQRDEPEPSPQSRSPAPKPSAPPTNSEADPTTVVDSFESYIVVSVLTATASFAALLDDAPEDNKGLASRSAIMHNIAIFCSAICSLGGMYATVVFSFSSIYGRTAIGWGRMDAYQQFLDNTAYLRYRAFYMYLLSLGLFMVLLVIAAVDKMDPDLELVFLVGLVAATLYMYHDWKLIVQLAGPIFAPPPGGSGSGSSSNKNSSGKSGTAAAEIHSATSMPRRRSSVGVRLTQKRSQTNSLRAASSLRVKSKNL